MKEGSELCRVEVARVWKGVGSTHLVGVFLVEPLATHRTGKIGMFSVYSSHVLLQVVCRLQHLT